MAKLSLKAIQRQIEALNVRAEKLKRRDKKPALRTIAGLMRDHGISVDDVRGSLNGGGKGHAAAKGNKRTGRKVAAMYKNPKTGETWTGRGRPARWIAAAEKAGHKRTEYLIKKA